MPSHHHQVGRLGQPIELRVSDRARGMVTALVLVWTVSAGALGNRRHIVFH